MKEKKRMMTRRIVRLYLLCAGIVLGVVLSACGQDEPTPRLVFAGPVELNPRGDTYLSLEIHNSGTAVFEGNEEAHSIMEITNETAGLLARLDSIGIDEVLPGGFLVIDSWNGDLQEGRNEIIWGAAGYGYLRVELLVSVENGQRDIVGETRRFFPDDDPPVDLGFGEAGPFVEQAKDDLAAKTGFAREDIRVHEVVTVTFEDASLGLPKPGQSYAAEETAGYVIDLTLAEKTYRYHAGGGHVVPVDDEET